MALIVADRVQETTSTTGTGTLTLVGAVSGFQSFAVIGNGNTTYYTIVSGTSWEVGIGTYTASGTTLSRDTVYASSAGGTTKITVASGATVFCSYPAEAFPYSRLYVGATAPTDTSLLWLDESDPTGVGIYGIPSGGASGQVLAKNSATSYDVSWVDQTGGGSEFGIPAGGTTGQVLVKSSNTDYDAAWETNNAYSGAAILDFGYAPGGNYASTWVENQTDISTNSQCDAWIQLEASPDHNAYEHAMVQMTVRAGNIDATNKKFEIVGISTERLTGRWIVQWARTL